MSIEVQSKNVPICGLPYEVHIKNHWQRLYKIPKDRNPTLMNNGNKDYFRNSGKVFYLCASNNPQPISLNSVYTIKRNINISEGQYLFLPIMSILYPEDDRGERHADEIIEQDQKSIKEENLNVEFNGNTNYAIKMDYEKLKNFEFDPKVIGSVDIYYPSDPDKCFYPIITSNPYHTQTRIGGHYLIVKPSKGKHEIHWKGELHSTATNSMDEHYIENMTYNVTVK